MAGLEQEAYAAGVVLEPSEAICETVAAGAEFLLQPGEYAVTRSDAQGRIIYCNRVFLELSGCSERELLGATHQVVRHPDMPAAFYRVLWGTLLRGCEFAGVLKNRARDAGYYWCRATVTPSYDYLGTLQGYCAVREVPDWAAVDALEPVYAELIRMEKSYGAALSVDEIALRLRPIYLRFGMPWPGETGWAGQR